MNYPTFFIFWHVYKNLCDTVLLITFVSITIKTRKFQINWERGELLFNLTAGRP